MGKLTRSVYKSPITALRVKVRSPREIRHPTAGDVIERIPGVYAEFGILGPEVPYLNQLTGEMDTAAQIIGGFYDLAAVASDKIGKGEWDEEIKAMVSRRLDALCEERPGMIQRVEHVTQPPAKPWPTYDSLEETARIVSLASDLGLLGAALSYERDNRGRTDLLAALEAAAGLHPDPEPEPEPVVALGPEAPVEKSAYRVVV